jgi:hypothetical protein
MGDIASWQVMIDWNEELLVRRTGEGSEVWAAKARASGVSTEAGLSGWLREQGVTGYGAMAVSWKLFGYPEFFLKSGDELIDGQYADRSGLRPVADRLMTMALSLEGVWLQARKTYVSVHSACRKFAQITPSNKSSLDLLLRVEAMDPRLEAVRVRPGDPFDRRLRFHSAAEVDDGVLAILERALAQNS